MMLFRRADMIIGGARKGLDPRQMQEWEANRFAINLLAPRYRCRRFLRRIPDLADVVDLSDDLDLSREAAARRYVELHQAPCAVVFASAGRLIYVSRNDAFPFIDLRRGDPLPFLSPPRNADAISDHQEADPTDWLGSPKGADGLHDGLIAQTLSQDNDRRTTLLAFDVE